MLTLVSESTAEPVTLPDALTHLRMDDIADSNVEIVAMISTARRMCEELLSADITQKTYDYSISQFPADYLALPRGPVQSITSVTYTDANGDSQTVSTGVYGLDSSNYDSMLYLKYGQSWPSSRYQHDSVTVRYVSGYASVPQPIKHAILMLVAELYNHRSVSVSTGAVPKEMPIAPKYLLAPYRRVVA